MNHGDYLLAHCNLPGWYNNCSFSLNWMSLFLFFQHLTSGKPFTFLRIVRSLYYELSLWAERNTSYITIQELRAECCPFKFPLFLIFDCFICILWIFKILFSSFLALLFIHILSCCFWLMWNKVLFSRF